MHNCADIVRLALAEDVGTGDVSAQLLPNVPVRATITAKQSAIISGIDYASQTFVQMDPNIVLNWHVVDGDCVHSEQILCELAGFAPAIITAERVALNFLQTLSATATQTRALMDKISHTNTVILDTRKTLPNLRAAQKHAVTHGGGANHRMGLYDCVMIKENHLKAFGSITQVMDKVHQTQPNLPCIVEVEGIQQLTEALTVRGVSRILCDNFSIPMLTQAVKVAQGRLKLEASGNIDADNILDYANTGVDYLSIGAITKHIHAIDLSLLII